MRYLNVCFLDSESRRIAGETIWASSIVEAIRIASARQRWNTAAQIRRAVGIQIWSGAKRIFSGKPDVSEPRTRVRDFRERAEETRVLAGKMADPAAKRNLGKIAENYARLAKQTPLHALG
jgi:hypothetical protein